MANNLCPQDYVNMITFYVNHHRIFDVDDLYNYCISKSNELDEGDEKRILHIINITLPVLLNMGIIAKYAFDNYKRLRALEFDDKAFVEDYDDTHRMTFSKSSLKTLFELEGTCDSVNQSMKLILVKGEKEKNTSN